MHLREPLLSVVLHAEKTRLVVEVVLEHEVQVRIEERSVIGHEVEGCLIEQYAAPRGLRRMRMDDAAPPVRLGFATRGPQLVLGERRPAAFADALRAEDL